MRTLYLRNVPDEVADNLEVLARRERMSVSAFAVRELTAAAARASNASLLADLPMIDVTNEDIVGAMDEGRAGR
ncbi:hypothetical protein [Georgenia sp. AZ-5]|uniref:hypothetical protein n=1 Tax=Georgenia sp. AZ-5 TaxID=3367526 RepID=UPI003754456B